MHNVDQKNLPASIFSDQNIGSVALDFLILLPVNDPLLLETTLTKMLKMRT